MIAVSLEMSDEPKITCQADAVCIKVENERSRIFNTYAYE